MTLFNRVIHDHNSYAALSVEDVLAKSSNIGAIQIGLKVGEQKAVGIHQEIRVRNANRNSDAGRIPRHAAVLGEVASGRDRSIAMGHEIITTRPVGAGGVAWSPTAACS